MKHKQLQIQEGLQMPQHSYLPANILFLCFVGHQRWIIHETPFHMRIVSGGWVSACSAPGKRGHFATGAVLCAIQGPALCSRVTGAAQAVPVASAVETAVCPPSVMAEMCGELLPNSMPLTTYPLPHTNNSHAMHHTHNSIKGVQWNRMTSGPEWATHHSLEWLFILYAKYWSRLYPPKRNLSCNLGVRRFVHEWNSKWFIV